MYPAAPASILCALTSTEKQLFDTRKWTRGRERETETETERDRERQTETDRERERGKKDN